EARNERSNSAGGGSARHRVREAGQDREQDADEVLGASDVHWRDRAASEGLCGASRSTLCRDLQSGPFRIKRAVRVYRNRTSERARKAWLRVWAAMDVGRFSADDCGDVPASDAL